MAYKVTSGQELLRLVAFRGSRVHGLKGLFITEIIGLLVSPSNILSEPSSMMFLVKFSSFGVRRNFNSSESNQLKEEIRASFLSISLRLYFLSPRLEY